MADRWVDIEDPREQFEAAFGVKLLEWQWDYIEHLRRGERLVPYGPRGSRWVPDERIELEAKQNAQIDFLYGPGAAAALDAAIKDGSVFGEEVSDADDNR